MFTCGPTRSAFRKPQGQVEGGRQWDHRAFEQAGPRQKLGFGRYTAVPFGHSLKKCFTRMKAVIFGFLGE